MLTQSICAVHPPPPQIKMPLSHTSSLFEKIQCNQKHKNKFTICVVIFGARSDHVPKNEKETTNQKGINMWMCFNINYILC